MPELKLKIASPNILFTPNNSNPEHFKNTIHPGDSTIFATKLHNTPFRSNVETCLLNIYALPCRSVHIFLNVIVGDDLSVESQDSTPTAGKTYKIRCKALLAEQIAFTTSKPLRSPILSRALRRCRRRFGEIIENYSE